MDYHLEGNTRNIVLESMSWTHGKGVFCFINIGNVVLKYSWLILMKAELESSTETHRR